MSNVIRHPAFESAPTTEATPPAQEVAFLDECLSRFRNRHAARSLVPQYTKKCIQSLMDLMAWAGTPLHALEEHHYEAWCAYLANDRKLERSTQRTYPHESSFGAHRRLHGGFICHCDQGGAFGQAPSPYGKAGTGCEVSAVETMGTSCCSTESMRLWLDTEFNGFGGNATGSWVAHRFDA